MRRSRFLVATASVAAAMILVATLSPFSSDAFGVARKTTKRARRVTTRPRVATAATTTVVATSSVAATTLAPTLAPTTTSIAPTTTSIAPTTTSIAPTTTSIAPTTTTVAPKPASSLVWTACGSEFDCTNVTVPRTYDGTSSETISIALKRLRATNQAQRKGAILLNPGGPGGSGIDLITKKPGVIGTEARQFYDVIGFDVRGLGLSTGLPCAGEQQRAAKTEKEYVLAVKEACDTRAPGLRQTVSTANTARDMDKIREALGDQKLNYLGISYGTYLGLVYADLFPDRVGRFVIDSAVDPTTRGIGLQVAQFTQLEQNLLLALNRCNAAGASCPFSDPDIVGRFERLIAKVGTKAVPATPYLVGPVTLLSVARSLLERPGGDALYFKLLAELERNDATTIYDVVRALDNKLPDPTDFFDSVESYAVYFQVACNEGFHPSTSPDAGNYVRLVTARAPHMVQLARAQAATSLCLHWDARSETRPNPVAKPGVPPMLFVSSTWDRITPYAGTEAVASRWPGSALLKVVSYEHGAVPDIPCANAAAASFFATGVLPAAGATC